MNPKIKIAILCLVVLLLAFFAFEYLKIHPLSKTPTTDQIKPMDLQYAEVATNTLPERFPTNFPLEKGTEVRSNYTAQSTSSFQSTRTFVSQKTVSENYTLYSAFLKKDGWKTLGSINHPDSAYLYAQKGPHTFVTIAIDKMPSNAKNPVEVSISFVYR